MSSGRTIVGSTGFFCLAIDGFPWTACGTRSMPRPPARGLRPLLGLDPRGLDELRVRGEFLLDHRLEVGQRHTQGLDAQLEEALAYVGGGHRGVDLLVEARHDVPRGPGSDQRSDPEVVVGVRVARLDRGRDVREERAAFRRADGERARLAFLDLGAYLEGQREIEVR